MSETTIYHNPSCGTSRNTLALLRHAGIEPVVIEHSKLCRSSEAELEILPTPPVVPFTKEDGEVIVDDGSRRPS